MKDTANVPQLTYGPWPAQPMERHHNTMFSDVCFGLSALVLCCFAVHWLRSRPVRSIEFWFGIYVLTFSVLAGLAYLGEYRKERSLIQNGLVTRGLIMKIKRGIRNNRTLYFAYPDPQNIMHQSYCEYINQADQPGQIQAVLLNRENYNEARPVTQFRFYRPVL